MKIFSTLLNVILTIRATHALMNDWKKPCTKGVCYYDLPHYQVSSSGTLMITGMPHTITDVTGASGWEILDCHPNKTEQDIRLVCSSPFAHCDHLFGNGGAEDKILRLPDNCGPNPFGRVVKTWDATDRSMPPHVAARLSRRYRTLPPVKSLRFDVNFHKIDAQKMGTVSLAILASTNPRIANEIHKQLSGSPPGKLEKRGLFSSIHHAIDKVADKIKDGVDGAANKVKDGVEGAANNVKDGAEGAANKVKDGVEEGANKVKDGVEEGANKVKNGVQQAVNSIQDGIQDGVEWLEDHTRFNADPSFTIPLLNVTKNGTVFKQAVACGPVTMGIDIEMELQASANVAFSIAIQGTLIPPTFHEFKVIPSFNADVDGTITLQSHLAMSLDSGVFRLFEMGIPALSIPGIFTIGPSLQVGVQAVATLDLALGARLAINYHVGHTQLTIPGANGNPVNDFTSQRKPIQLSIAPEGASAVALQVRLIPRLNFGVTAFTSEVVVWVDLEAYLMSTITIGAETNTIHPLQSREAAGVRPDVMDDFRQTELGKGETSAPAHSTDIKPRQRPSTNTQTNNQPGCWELDMYVDLNFGADSDFFGIFPAYYKITFFRIEFQLIKKCFMTTFKINAPRALAPTLPGTELELHRGPGTVINRRSTSRARRGFIIPRSSIPVAKRSASCLNGTAFNGFNPVVDEPTNPT